MRSIKALLSEGYRRQVAAAVGGDCLNWLERYVAGVFEEPDPNGAFLTINLRDPGAGWDPEPLTVIVSLDSRLRRNDE